MHTSIVFNELFQDKKPYNNTHLGGHACFENYRMSGSGRRIVGCQFVSFIIVVGSPMKNYSTNGHVYSNYQQDQFSWTQDRSCWSLVPLKSCGITVAVSSMAAGGVKCSLFSAVDMRIASWCLFLTCDGVSKPQTLRSIKTDFNGAFTPMICCFMGGCGGSHWQIISNGVTEQKLHGVT